ncbi:ribosome silencing factor [uncultured Litoreibacter sp.]|uniref:ribosome silencing factor n=1 Tax=uncultured Litoreibacter sp. TaxID=1392394 RepID=UPI002629E1D2|nr:ribosome silencing factor [uncultured Litoreibacter sp.]
MAANAATSPAKAATKKDPGTSEELLARIVEFLESEKAEELVQVDLRGRSEIADYMVICSGRSTRQVTSLAEKLTDTIKQEFGRYGKMEGKSQGDWVLLDTGDVVVHIFRPEVREFYQLEKMWLPGGGADAE